MEVDDLDAAGWDIIGASEAADSLASENEEDLAVGVSVTVSSCKIDKADCEPPLLPVSTEPDCVEVLQPVAGEQKSCSSLSSASASEESSASLVPDHVAAAAAAAAAEEAWRRDHVELELRSVKMMKEGDGMMELAVKGGPKEQRRVLPIHMGESETQALIRYTTAKAGAPAAAGARPMTHDLLIAVIAACGGRVSRIDVADYKGTVFHARIHIVRRDVAAAAAPAALPAPAPAAGGTVEEGEGERAFDAVTTELDCRPSDAVNIAVRAKAPIFARRHVVQLMSRIEK